jgi:hypothetical protein
MEIFADVNNGIVENIIVGEAGQPVQQLLAKKHLAVLVNDHSGFPCVGLRWNGQLEKFEQAQPFQSWSWDEESFEWVPPVPKPEGLYYWNEADLKWEAMQDLIPKD